MKKPLIFTLLTVLTCFAVHVNAQTDSCIVKLKNANTGYEQGEYDETIRLLRSALAKCSLDKTDKIQANKLLIMTYLKVDNLEEADKSAAEIMKTDPYYKPDKFKDDPKLSALFEKYKPRPMLRLGLSGGINISSTDQVKSYSIVHDINSQGLDSYNSQTGFQLGASGEYRTYKKLWIGLGFIYRKTGYEHVLDSIENSTVTFSEKLSYFDLPLSIKYYIAEGTLSPFVEAGAKFSFLTNALSKTSRSGEEDLVNRTDFRNSFGAGYFGGAGLMYSMNALNFMFNVRYTYYPDNVNKDGTRYSDLVNVFKYYYIDDDFRMDHFQVNLGVCYNLSYKNVKVK